jgi:hypothetical protein
MLRSDTQDTDTQDISLDIWDNIASDIVRGDNISARLSDKYALAKEHHKTTMSRIPHCVAAHTIHLLA